MVLSSTTRKQGQRGCRPFPLHPNPRRPSSAFLRTIPLDDSEHLFENHHVSVASLRLLFTSLRNGVRLPPESMFTFTGIPTWALNRRCVEGILYVPPACPITPVNRPR
jgi:hypothetical protein